MSKAERGTIYDISVPGRRGVDIPAPQVPNSPFPSRHLLRDRPPHLPSVSELAALRYFEGLASMNFSVEKGPYPLGSCTMKGNPEINESIAKMPEVADVHPAHPELAHGTLFMLHELQGFLGEITGMSAFSLSPMAGAQGELAGVLMMKKYYKDRGERRTKVLIPDTAHGTNPASAAMAGFEVVTIKSDPEGNTNLEELKANLDSNVAGMMLTLPNTLGLFDKNAEEAIRLLHENGSLAYMDGANMNALMGWLKPGELGFDIMHLNVHKTFATPHGGGGPGAGPVGVQEFLADFLPGPVVEKEGEHFRFKIPDKSIGRLGNWYGNVGVLTKAWGYIRTMGEEGLRASAENAVVNANYLRESLRGDLEVSYHRAVMHEVVFSAGHERGSATNFAKRLIDLGFHPPTVYFPLVVHEAIMVEPTESETLEDLDDLTRAMREIVREANLSPEVLENAPHNTPVGRLDDVFAARQPYLRWKPESDTEV